MVALASTFDLAWSYEINITPTVTTTSNGYDGATATTAINFTDTLVVVHRRMARWVYRGLTDDELKAWSREHRKLMQRLNSAVRVTALVAASPPPHEALRSPPRLDHQQRCASRLGARFRPFDRRSGSAFTPPCKTL